MHSKWLSEDHKDNLRLHKGTSSQVQWPPNTIKLDKVKNKNGKCERHSHPPDQGDHESTEYQNPRVRPEWTERMAWKTGWR